MMSAIEKELQLRAGLLNGKPVNTIYFGGGTPSLVPLPMLESLLQKIFQQLNVQSGAEITLEANPDDISLEVVRNWQSLGINRLSMGVQSFREADLRWMNRAHNALQAEAAIHAARAAGLHNFSIDLIYGTPGMHQEDWAANVEKAIALRIPHLSAYALTVESGTALQIMINRHKVKPPEESEAASHFEYLMDAMEKAGYHHYEISNWALPGGESRHNSSYWQGVPYLGLGPGAHSFDGSFCRSWMVANNVMYIQQLQSGMLPLESEMLTPVQRANEYIMTSLRTSGGMYLRNIPFRNSDEKLLEKYRTQGWIAYNEERVWLTRTGKAFADGIAASFFRDEMPFEGLAY